MTHARGIGGGQIEERMQQRADKACDLRRQHGTEGTGVIRARALRGVMRVEVFGMLERIGIGIGISIGIGIGIGVGISVSVSIGGGPSTEIGIGVSFNLSIRIRVRHPRRTTRQTKQKSHTVFSLRRRQPDIMRMIEPRKALTTVEQ